MNGHSNSYEEQVNDMEEFKWDSDSNKEEEFSWPLINAGSEKRVEDRSLQGWANIILGGTFKKEATIEGGKPAPALEWETEKSPEIEEFHFIEYKNAEQKIKDDTGFENTWRICPSCGGIKDGILHDHTLQKIPLKHSYIRVDSNENPPGNKDLIMPGIRDFKTLKEIPKRVGDAQEHIWACRVCRYAETEFPEVVLE